MTRRIIIPAAGEAARFGGIPKELLPVGEGETCLSRAVKLARKFGDPVVISNPHKAPLHRRVCPDVPLVVRENYREGDLWGSIRAGLLRGHPGGLVLADTIATVARSCALLQNPEEGETPPGITLGLFATGEPARFSLIVGGRIVTKPKLPPKRSAYLAWGMAFWSAGVTAFFQAREFTHYDDAFNEAMQQFGASFFFLENYHDIGTFTAYREYLQNACP